MVRKLFALLMAFSVESAFAQPVIVTGSQQPYPIEAFEIGPNDSRYVHAIGIYEANSNHYFGYNPRYDASIVVEPQGANSIYLVLNSYESVNWVFSGAGLASISGVLITGHNQHSFSGIDAALVDNVSGDFAYLTPVCYTVRGCGGLLSFASSRIGDQIDSLVSTYNANAFLIQSTASGVPEPSSWAMMLTGFGLLGATVRRKPTAVAIT